MERKITIVIEHIYSFRGFLFDVAFAITLALLHRLDIYLTSLEYPIAEYFYFFYYTVGAIWIRLKYWDN
jgi:hypothetical protein